MNITEEVVVALSENYGSDVAEKLKNTTEIQIYANHSILEYQWRDSRFPKFSDVWENESYETRTELYEGINKYLTK